MNRKLAVPAALACTAAFLSAAPLAARAEAAPKTTASASAYHLVQAFSVGGEGGWDYLSLDPDARRLYITRMNYNPATRGASGGYVQVLNADTGKLIGTITDVKGPHGVVFAPKLGRGFISSGGDGSVVVFDLKTLKTTARIPAGTGPDGICFAPDVNRVFAFNGRSKDATVIDAKTLKVVGTVPLGGRPEFPVADGAGHVYDNIEDTSEIVDIDAKTLAITHRWSLAPAQSPSGLAMDVKRRLLFPTCDDGKMPVVSADTGKVLLTASIGAGPDAAVYDAGTNLASASCGESGTLSTVSVAANESATASVPTQASARTLALDPKTHRIYLAAARYRPELLSSALPAGGGRHRPPMVPGSFTILVMGR